MSALAFYQQLKSEARLSRKTSIIGWRYAKGWAEILNPRPLPSRSRGWNQVTLTIHGDGHASFCRPP